MWVSGRSLTATRCMLASHQPADVLVTRVHRPSNPASPARASRSRTRVITSSLMTYSTHQLFPDENCLPVEHVHLGVRHLAVHQQQHTGVGHGLQGRHVYYAACVLWQW